LVARAEEKQLGDEGLEGVQLIRVKLVAAITTAIKSKYRRDGINM
jgi:hypothetical protein